MEILARSDIVFIDSYESSKTLRVVSRTGRAYPSHCTSVGKAILARLGDKDIAKLFPTQRLQKLTFKAIAIRAELLGQLAIIRACGHAINMEEAEGGVDSVAMAIEDRHGIARTASSIAAPTVPITATTASGLVKLVHHAEKETDARL